MFPSRVRSGSGDEQKESLLDPRHSPPGSRAGLDVESFGDACVRRSRHWIRRNVIVSWAGGRLRLARRGLRQPLSLLWCLLYVVVPVVAALLVFVPIFAPSYLHPPPHYRELKARCQSEAAAPGCANPSNEKVFICVSLYDQGGKLAAGRWGKALLEVIQLIGPNNVFLSIYENDSGPEGAAALEELKSKVPCRHSIVNEPHVHMNVFPNVTMPDGTKRVKRLAYLTEIRNRALRPLDVLNQEDGIVPFDKVLFLNDIAFHPIEAAQLLFSTNVRPDGRTNYVSACALDYRTPLMFYDTYAQRDAEGYSNGLPFFPIFTNSGRGLSRSDMRSQKDAVRVKGCWAGMVAMQARYVQNLEPTLPRPDFQRIGSHVIDPSRPRNVTAPIRFRYEPEVFVDGCECCFLLADAAQAARRAGARETGTFVNPYVRVAYDWQVLFWERIVRRWERLFPVPHAILSSWAGLPRHNPHRTVQEGEPFVEEVWNSEEQRWELVQRVGRNGLFCVVREMQLIKERQGDRNWVSVPIPPGQNLHFET